MHPDLTGYYKFTGRARLDKSLNSLTGLIEGIALDGQVNDAEMSFLNHWISEHSEVMDRHPYNELIPIVRAAVEDGVLHQDERDDILWLSERLRSTQYYDQTTADLQRLHGIVGGVIADRVISEAELRGLSIWLSDHDHLTRCWPYDEIGSLITAVLSDRKIDEQEQAMLRSFFSEFVRVFDERTIVSPTIELDTKLVGLCAVCPDIQFVGQKFCFTGCASRHTRTQLAEIVAGLGGEVVSGLTSTVSYLVIGAEGNPCWAYACYGRKVEKAVSMRKAGSRLLLVHENDFHDAVADRSAGLR